MTSPDSLDTLSNNIPATSDPGRMAGPTVSIQALRGIDLFKDMPQEKLQALAQASHWHHYEAGYTIPASCVSGFCVVVSGSVLITTYEISGRQVAFQAVSAGDCFGAVSVLQGVQASEAPVAVTMKPSLIAQIPPRTFLEMVDTDITFARIVMQHLAQIVRRFSERIVSLSTMTVRGRVLAALLRMSHRAGVQGNQARLEPGPPHQVLANFVGATREQVSRELSALQREGMIKKDGRAVVILDVAGLQQLLGQTKAKG